MPVHDWGRVDQGTFHDFHSAWIIHLKETLNGGLLPDGYYALAEQADAPPQVSRKVVAGPNALYRATRRTLTIRHVTNHRIVALVKVLSPANKDRRSSVTEFVEKVHSALRSGCHLLVIDLFPPGANDPHGIHGAIWESFDAADYALPPDKPFTLAAYVAVTLPEAYLEHVAIGNALPQMPLFLHPESYIRVPLEATYQEAYRGIPAFWRDVVEGRELPPPS